MFCPECGKEISSEDRFCMYCGANLSELNPEPADLINPADLVEEEAEAVFESIEAAGLVEEEAEGVFESIEAAGLVEEEAEGVFESIEAAGAVQEEAGTEASPEEAIVFRVERVNVCTPVFPRVASFTPMSDVLSFVLWVKASVPLSGVSGRLMICNAEGILLEKSLLLSDFTEKSEGIYVSPGILLDEPPVQTIREDGVTVEFMVENYLPGDRSIPVNVTQKVMFMIEESEVERRERELMEHDGPWN